jgi:hypothetical protein
MYGAVIVLRFPKEYLSPTKNAGLIGQLCSFWILQTDESIPIEIPTADNAPIASPMPGLVQ